MICHMDSSCFGPSKLPHAERESTTLSISSIMYIRTSCNIDGSSDRTESLLKWLGRPPGYTTLRVNTHSYQIEAVKRAVADELEKQYAKEKKSSPPKVSIHSSLTDTLVIENRGPNEITRAPREVIVGLGCAMAVLRGAHVFAQGIMGCPQGLVVGDVVSVYGDINATCRRGFMKNFDDPKVFVGNGVMCLSRLELFGGEAKNVSGLAIKMTDPLYDAPSLNEVLMEQIFPQNLPSIICGHLLDPQPGETILDMCAAPGGKTVHLATLMKNMGTVIAFDKNTKKIDRIKENASKWGATCIQAYIQDGRKSCDHSADNSSMPPYKPGTFDRILLDVPCSALGQRPASSNAMSIKEIQSYPPLQAKLFTQAVSLLKVGGTLVYSTCTVFKEENEQRVAWALSKFPELDLVPQAIHLGGHGFSAPGLSKEQQNMLQRFDPSYLDNIETLTPELDTIGFFIAKFVKR